MVFNAIKRAVSPRLFWPLIFPPSCKSAFAIVIFALIQGVLKYLCNYLSEWTGNKMSNNLKMDLFEKLTSMDTKFFDINSSGLVLSRFLTDPEQASKKLIETLKSFILCAFELVALVAVLLYNSWKLAIIGVTVMGIAMIPVTLIRKHIKKVSNATMVVTGNMTTNFNETFAGNKIITAYVNDVCSKILYNTAVFKKDKDGVVAFNKFLDYCELKLIK